MAKYLSGKIKRTPQSELTSDRYQYLAINQAEPNLGDPVLPGPTLPVGTQYQSVSIIGYPGERYWVPVGGGLIPGTISIYDEGTLTPAGGVSSITQLNFVGAAITAKGYSNLDGSPGVGVTITVFSPGTQGQVIFNNNNDFKGASGLFYDNSTNYVGIGTTVPTQELDLTGDLRLRGTIYDYNNQPGNNAEILVKNNFGGLIWVNQNTVRSGAGGTITNIQYHNSAGLVDGASNFVFDYINSRVGIGSTLPAYLFDVKGYSRFTGQTEIDYLRVTGVSTIAALGVTGLTTTRDLQVTGFSTFTGYIDANGGAYIDNIQIGITDDNTIDTTTGNLTIGSNGGRTSITGIASVGFITATTGFVGILTVTEINIDRTNLINLNVTGIATIATLGVGGLTTTRYLNVIGFATSPYLNVTGIASVKDLNVTGIATINNLNVTGVGTFDNIKLDTDTISTTTGNLILDSNAGTTQINDDLFVNSATESTDKDTGSIVTNGGVGIEKNLNVGGNFSVSGITILASSGGISTTGGDLYVKGNLYVSNDIFYDELFARNGYFTGIVSTRDLNVTGIATIATLGVTGLTTTRNLKVIGISTFDNYIDANGGAYIDNIQLGITNDNTIDTTTGNLTIGSNGGTTTINNNLIVSGISIFNGNVVFGDATTDTVSFTSRVSSAILPSTDGTLNLGGTSNKWNNIYANNFVGAITGNADTATRLTTPREIDIDGDVIGVGIGTTFDGSKNVTIPTVLSTTGVTAGTYGSATQVGIVTVDAKGRITSASNINIDFSTATRASYADNAGISTNLKGGIAYQIPVQTGPSSTGFIANIAGNQGWLLQSNGTTSAPSWSDPTAISVGTASSLNVTTDTSSSPRYLVLSSTLSGITTALVDSGITYTPSTDLLTVSKIKPTQIQDTGGGTGTDNYVLTANGSGGWSWKVAGTSSGGTAISGITIQEEGGPVGTSITTINFKGTSVTATSPSAGTADITITTNINDVGSANQVLYKNASNVATGSTNFQFNGSTVFVNGDIYSYGNFINSSSSTSSSPSTNVRVGYLAGTDAVGNPNTVDAFLTCIGASAGRGGNGFSNVAVGVNAGLQVSGNINVFVGNNAGSNCNGSANLIIGANAGLDQTGNGNVIIGAGASAANLNGNYQLSIGNGEDNTWIYGNNSYFVGMGTKSPTERLHVQGNIRATGSFVGSDIDLKKNIQTIPNALDKVLQLRGVEFDWKDTNKHQIGVIAQEVEKIIPEVVVGENGDKAVAYQNLVAVLIEAIKEQQEIIVDLQNRLEILEGN
tara:strand:+ start:3272 stop:7120 length:3849 start_codon:yes stop_codon:yes gene_type:complete